MSVEDVTVLVDYTVRKFCIQQVFHDGAFGSLSQMLSCSRKQWLGFFSIVKVEALPIHPIASRSPFAGAGPHDHRIGILQALYRQNCKVSFGSSSDISSWISIK